MSNDINPKLNLNQAIEEHAKFFASTLGMRFAGIHMEFKKQLMDWIPITNLTEPVTAKRYLFACFEPVPDNDRGIFKWAATGQVTAGSSIYNNSNIILDCLDDTYCPLRTLPTHYMEFETDENPNPPGSPPIEVSK
jgi:hypothetical protein